MEIITEPDIQQQLMENIISFPRRSSEEAAGFLKKLQHLLRHTGVSTGSMDQVLLISIKFLTNKGDMRCDVNISVRKRGDPLGIRTEIKNLIGIRNVMKAIGKEFSQIF